MIASADTLVHPRAIDALINKRNNKAQNSIELKGFVNMLMKKTLEFDSDF
jgi:hypothetical protein